MRLPRPLTVPLAVAALLALAGCGQVGNPLPPSLDLPRPVSDLKAARKGDQVLLTWTTPRETTDRLPIKEGVTTCVCRAPAALAAKECSQVGEAAPRPAPGARASFTDVLPHEQARDGVAVYTVEVLNDRGRSAGLSNAVQVRLVPTLPPPSAVRARVTAEGVILSWSALPPAPGSYSLRIYRQAAGAAAPVIAGEMPLPAAPEFLDKSFEWEKTYQYRITVVTFARRNDAPPEEIEGDDSAAVEVFVHDVFPPAVPTAVQAVASSGGGTSFIDLTWTPNGEADLAGYNVYRREAGAQPVKINGELLKTPAFRDASVAAGHTYFYSVSAVDLRNNESGHSEEESETVPQP